MAAELHLAEETFALHLLLQRLEGLVDIVVADENLHVVFLFKPTGDRPNSQGAWATGGYPQTLPITTLSLYPEPKRFIRISLYSIRLFTGNEKLRQKNNGEIAVHIGGSEPVGV